MTAAVATAEDLQLKRFLVYSLIFHGSLVLLIAASIYIQNLRGPEWGGPGGEPGSAKVKLVGAAPGLPMPTAPTPKDTSAVDPTKGLHKEEPKPKPEPPTKAEKITPFKKEKPLPPTHKSKTDEPRVPDQDNAVPFGNNRGANLPSSYAPNTGSGSSAAMQGQGGGDFARLFPTYVESVIRSINKNWDQTMIEPAVLAAHRAHTVMTFRIYRDGSIANVQTEQKSGNTSMDNSAIRTLDGIRFLPLPSSYTGAYVEVTFDFDLALKQ